MSQQSRKRWKSIVDSLLEERVGQAKSTLTFVMRLELRPRKTSKSDRSSWCEYRELQAPLIKLANFGRCLGQTMYVIT